MPDPFITRTDLTNILGRNVDADAGALMAVDAACDEVRRLTEQRINLGTSTITMDGTGTDALLLPERPLGTVSAVSVAGTAVTNYVTDTRRGMAFRTYGTVVNSAGDTVVAPGAWPAGRQNVQVTYSHGWDLNSTEFPRDLKMLAISIAERLIIQGPHSSENTGDVSATYAVPQMDLTPTEKWIVAKYRSR